ncbi:MAG: tRNA epoxyqueuosine(34) reductase QueG [Saprospiraceae bacterium]|nr:tRNA epoxyqueuosine(34) reductase QueG [Saprospiraceae bacterium]
MDDIGDNTRKIKSMALNFGFSFVGIAKARVLDKEAKLLEQWLNSGYHGKMSYMENHFDKRIDPTKLVPGAKSVISLLYNYYTEARQDDSEAPKISRYAYGADYHVVIREKLKDFLAEIRIEIGQVDGRCFVDSAPVMERDWAKYAGLGWTGKNTLLINPKAGSYFFLAELILDLELEPDEAIRDHCGTCTRCIDACPTEAIAPNGYIVDGTKCISYLTIELKEAIPDEFSGKMENWVFGCDICQQVCPWNRFSQEHREPQFVPSEPLLEMTKREWIELTEEVFQTIFRHSAVKRTKFNGLRRNIDFLQRE